MVSQKKNKIKICRECGVVLTAKNWAEANKKIGHYTCKVCQKRYFQEYCKNNQDKRKEGSRKYHKEHKLQARSRELKRLFGITLKQYDEMLETQGGVCAICGEPEKGKHQNGKIRRLSVDHNHQTGKVRGLLCVGCNVRLGVLDNKSFVKKAMKYLGENGEV